MIEQQFYVHRVHSNVLVQQILVRNDAHQPLTFDLSLPTPEKGVTVASKGVDKSSFTLVTGSLKPTKQDLFTNLQYMIGVSEFTKKLTVPVLSRSKVDILSVIQFSVSGYLTTGKPVSGPLTTPSTKVIESNLERTVEAALKDLAAMKLDTLRKQQVETWNRIYKVSTVESL